MTNESQAGKLSVVIRRENVEMKIHEYQAKAILTSYKVPVPRGEVAFDPEQAYKIAQKLGVDTIVLKAQVHAGGRGKGGGIRLAHSPEEARQIAKEMIGMTLVTHQTGPQGKKVRRLLVEEGMQIEKELYLGIVVDRSTSRAVFMASEAGGVDIEQVAAETPEKILKEPVEPSVGFQGFQARKLAYGLGWDKELVSQGVKVMMRLYRAFQEKDCSLAEINPLIINHQKELVALDAKLNFDDNALFRHPDIVELRDLDEEEPLEVEASKSDLSYIKLDGNIGCMVNGAGLAMATMDLIKQAGGEPANFLDVGGAASAERVADAFRILMSDERVKAVLINIFGGIVRCDRVAQGVIEAIKEVKVQVPIVVRLEGTNAEEAAELLRQSKLNFVVAKGFKEAADMAVRMAKA